mmetsp:Transcript_62847/g.93411  ORF Transcript_62847/g.93411 Transcript_62847/m.93411 type:complete len:382 (-) Transcript_62847:269-1414(-)
MMSLRRLLLLTASTATHSFAFRNIRWLWKGAVSEIFTNAVLGRRAIPPLPSPYSNDSNGYNDDDDTLTSPPVAIVTGATGGLGVVLCEKLQKQGYSVIVAARDPIRGKALVDQLHDDSSLNNGRRKHDARFVRYDANEPSTAKDVALALDGRPCAILINNAGVMKTNISDTMKVNLIGPSILTLTLLPSLRKHPNPVVVNVGSSAHLRAEADIDPKTLEDDTYDNDLAVYASSKLGLMHFSQVLRETLWTQQGDSLSTTSPSWRPIVIDAHPGIVWTPLLRNYYGSAAKVVEKLKLSHFIFKSPEVGAGALLSATFFDQTKYEKMLRKQKTYFSNGKSGYGSSESRDMDACRKTWEQIIQPAVMKVAPDECRMISNSVLNV